MYVITLPIPGQRAVRRIVADDGRLGRTERNAYSCAARDGASRLRSAGRRGHDIAKRTILSLLASQNRVKKKSRSPGCRVSFLKHESKRNKNEKYGKQFHEQLTRQTFGKPRADLSSDDSARRQGEQHPPIYIR